MKHVVPCECLMGRDAICRWLGISKNTFYRLLKQGLPASLRGGTWIANTSEINDWSRLKSVHFSLAANICRKKS